MLTKRKIFSLLALILLFTCPAMSMTGDSEDGKMGSKSLIHFPPQEADEKFNPNKRPNLVDDIPQQYTRMWLTLSSTNNLRYVGVRYSFSQNTPAKGEKFSMILWSYTCYDMDGPNAKTTRIVNNRDALSIGEWLPDTTQESASKGGNDLYMKEFEFDVKNMTEEAKFGIDGWMVVPDIKFRLSMWNPNRKITREVATGILTNTWQSFDITKINGAVLDNTKKCYKGTYEKKSNKQEETRTTDRTFCCRHNSKMCWVFGWS